MSKNIILEVVTPNCVVAREEVRIVMAPGALGEFGVLAGHTPFMTSLKIGTVTYRTEKGDEGIVFVSGGFAEALPDRVTILAESAEKKQHIDLNRAQSAVDRAQQRLASKNRDDIDYVRAKLALDRALERVKIAGARV